MTPRWSYANASSENTAVYTELVPVMEVTLANSTKVTLPVTIATSQPVKSLPEGRPVISAVYQTKSQCLLLSAINQAHSFLNSLVQGSCMADHSMPASREKFYMLRFTVPNNAHHIKALRLPYTTCV